MKQQIKNQKNQIERLKIYNKNISNIIQDNERRKIELSEKRVEQARNSSQDVLSLLLINKLAEKPDEASKFARQINNEQRAGLREGFEAKLIEKF